MSMAKAEFGGADMSQLVDEVGQRIKDLRRRAGYTLEELGARLGIKGHSVWRLETGRRTPSLELLESLSGILGVSPAYFLGGQSCAPAPRSTQPDDLDPLLRDLWVELHECLHREQPLSPERAKEILCALIRTIQTSDSSARTVRQYRE